MRRIIKEKQPFEQSYKTLDEARAILSQTDQTYKIEYAQELIESGRAGDEGLGFYVNGPFTDLCEGPHLEHTGEVPKACFKLDRISGSYWRGSEKNPMLTRIYGLAFESKADLTDYIERRKLAMERDHRKLGQELDLFSFHEIVGSGLPLFHPKGGVIKVTKSFLMLVIYAVAMTYLGFVITTPFATAAFIYDLKGNSEVKPVSTVIISVVVTAVLYAMFVFAFQIKLPAGVLFGG